MFLSTALASLAGLSFAIQLWQWFVARLFPAHHRLADGSFQPAVTVLKPLKGCDKETAGCLRSWLRQNYDGPIQILFGVKDASDPVCGVVRELLATHPEVDAKQVICGASLGANAKVSTLIQLDRSARHDFVVISDADVWVPADLVTNVVAPLREPGVGLVSCFYRFADPVTLAMHWEAVAINADFWSQVLQSRSLKPIDFALGAVMATRRGELEAIGGFKALADYLADDFRLGNQVAKAGKTIALCSVIANCRPAPMEWRQIWAHQLRWARTIRVCQPLLYFFSILSNGTLWPLLWLAAAPGKISACVVAAFLFVRYVTARANMNRLAEAATEIPCVWMVWIKDLLQVVLWALAFTGNRIEWRGEYFRIEAGGKLVRIDPPD